MTSAFPLAARITAGKPQNFTIFGGTQFVARWKAIPNRSRVCERPRAIRQFGRRARQSCFRAGVRPLERSLPIFADRDDNFAALNATRKSTMFFCDVS